MAFLLVVHSCGSDVDQNLDPAGDDTPAAESNLTENEEEGGESVDNVAPTVSITSNQAILTAESSFSVTITFSEVVEGFELSDIEATNASVSNLTEVTESKVYTVTVTPSEDPVTVSLSVPAEAASDSAENDSEASNTFSIRCDSSALTATITSSASSPTNSSPFSVTITFSEEVSGFVVGDIDVANGSASNLVTSGNPVFTVDITPTSDGDVTVSVDADVAADALTGEKSNTAPSDLVRAYDETAPTLSSLSPANEATEVSVSSSIAVTFDEAMKTSSITTNTADTDCDGSIQVSADSFSTCVQMDAAPVASNGDKTFTLTPASNLSNSETYKIRVTTLATDAAGNGIASNQTQATGFTTVSTPKILRMLSGVTYGNMGGVAGADALCASAYDASYKALIVADTGNPSTSRIACTSSNCGTGGLSEHVDWVLSPNTTYVRSDGTTVIGTTNEYGIFTGTLTNYIDGGGYPPMTGLSGTTWMVNSGNTCSDWTSSSGDAGTGNPHQPSVWIAFGGGTYACNGGGNLMSLFCVAQ